MSNLKLQKNHRFDPPKRPVLFVIVDGYGLTDKDNGNCVHLAKQPHFDSMIDWAKKNELYAELKAHGTSVGLPSDKDMGNSEVGHNALGAGRVFSQGAKLVNDAIDSRSLFETQLWKNLTNLGEKNSFHLFGLLSDGNVHSHIEQVFGLLNELAAQKVKRVRVHPLLDGRDVPPKSGLEYIEALEKRMAKLNEGHGVDFRIASGGGRMRVTMDRYESDWGVVKRGWDAHVRGVAETREGYAGYFKTVKEAVETARSLDESLTDQYLPSFVIVDDENKPVGPIVDGDTVVNFNFRGDRAIQISKAFEYEDFDKFAREVHPKVQYAGMLQYDGDLQIPKNFLVSPPAIDKTIGEYLCAEGVTQFACAETHKYGHVTYFWNGNNSGYINEELEKYVEVQSEPTEMIATNPEMKANEVCDAVIEALKSKKYQFLRVNFANPDMVGHTGIVEAGVRAVEVVDKSLGRLKEVITELDGVMLITADHGNVEELEGKHKTSHTLNPVPFFIWDPKFQEEYTVRKNFKEPQLANIAATILDLLGFEKPEEYYETLLEVKS